MIRLSIHTIVDVKVLQKYPFKLEINTFNLNLSVSEHEKLIYIKSQYKYV